MVEGEAGAHCAERQHEQRRKHDQRTFVRVIARGAVAMSVVVIRVRVVIVTMAMIVMHRMLDMFALRPPRLAVEGQEDEAP